MATTKAPLFGLDASGTIAGALVFSKWRGRTYVRRHAIPANPNSPLQVAMRASMKFMTQAWAGLSSGNKAEWEDLARVDNVTGLNAMVRYNQPDIRNGFGITMFPTAVNPPPLTGVTSLAAAAQVRSALVTWGHPAGGMGTGPYFIYGAAGSSITPAVDNLIGVVPVDQLQFTWTGLSTGVEYSIAVLPSGDAGDLGVDAGDVQVTPT